MLNWDIWPLWATLLKRAITAFIFICFGLHAYVQYRRHGKNMAVPERWTMIVFSIIFLIGTIINGIAFVIAYERQLKQGPFEFGFFSLLITVVYLVFLYRSHRHSIY